jgi:hypothetical protein
MPVIVTLIGSDFLTGAPRVYHHTFDADDFNIIQSADQSLAHLSILKDNGLVAYFPAGNWCGVELKKGE